MSNRIRHEEIQWIFWPNSKIFGVRMQKQSKIHIPRDFLGIVGIFRGEKEPQIIKLENISHPTFDLLINPDNFVILNIFQFFSIGR
jgi:hypothetical protein